MNFLLKFLFISIFSFTYADCIDIDNQIDCLASDDCEWHADEGACEEIHNEEHNQIEIMGLAEGFTTFTISIMHDGHADYTSMPIPITVGESDHDDHEHCDEMTEDECLASDDCEWHADEGACEEIGHDHDEECTSGDVNSDEEINVQDVVAILTYILDIPGIPEPECANINQDLNIDILDIVMIVDIILGERTHQATSATFTKKNNTMLMNANGSVSAIQMTISHDTNFSLELTRDAFAADYITNGAVTTLIIVNPTDEILFITDDHYNIEEVAAATGEGYITANIVTPNVITISDAFPNPFNPSTSFDVNIGNSGFLTLSIYNINGQLVDIIHEGEMSAGIYSMTWNPNNLSSGIYILKAVSTGQVSTQKLTLLK